MNSDRKPDFDSQDPRDPPPHPELLDGRQTLRKFVFGCIGAVLLLFFVGWYIVLGIIFEEANDGRDAVNWPTTSGQVVETKVSSHTSTTSSGSGRRRATSRTTSYVPWVLYRYSVSGLELENDKVQTMTSYDTRAEAKQVIEQYPVDSTVTVYYKPDDPDKSVLVPGIPEDSYLVLNLFTYIPAGIISILLLIWVVRRMRSSL